MLSRKRTVSADIVNIAMGLTDHPHVYDITEAKTKTGPHRPDKGTEYDELKVDSEFSDCAKHNTPCDEKGKPEKGMEPKVDPGDGAKLGRKPSVATPKKFKKVSKNLKKKSKPAKVTDNRTEKDGKHYPKTSKMTIGDSLESAVDVIIDSMDRGEETE